MSAAGWKEARLLLAFVLLGFMLAGLATIALSGGGGGGPAAVAPSALARAAYITADQRGYRFSMDLTGSLAGRTFAVGGSGSIVPPGRGSFQMTINGTTISELVAFPDVYVNASGLGSSSLASTPWVKASMSPLMPSSSSLGSESDPTQFLNYLKASGSVAVVDSEPVRGVITTRYHALIDLGRYPSVLPSSLKSVAQQETALLQKLTGLSALPVDAWIDHQSRVRRIALQMPFCTAAGTGSESITMDLYDYGRQPPVTLPDASQVTDITRLVSAQLSQSSQQAHCS
jgi:hypothetical protein